MGNNHFGWQTISDAGNLAISCARDFRHRTYVTGQGTDRNQGRRDIFNQERVLTVQQKLYLSQAVNAMAVFKNYLAGNLADRIRFLQSRAWHHQRASDPKRVRVRIRVRPQNSSRETSNRFASFAVSDRRNEYKRRADVNGTCQKQTSIWGEYFDCICVLCAEDVLEDEEFILLLEDITRPALELPYWKFPRLNVADISDCLTEIRFEKEDFPRLACALRLPPKFMCSNGTTANDIEALCLLLRRFAYPWRYSDLIPRFGRSIPEMSQITGEIMGYMSTTFEHLLRTVNQPWLQLNKLEE